MRERRKKIHWKSKRGSRRRERKRRRGRRKVVIAVSELQN